MDLTQEDLPLVSVIIPAYNAETRIADTLASVIAQDYANIEIVVVNDCSTDRTAEIARDVLGKSGRRHKVIDHERNRGVSAARNTGIDGSSGGSLSFIDADDIVETNFISQLMEHITEDDADIALCGYKDKDVERDETSDVRIGLATSLYRDAEHIACLKILKKIDTAAVAMMLTRRFADDKDLRFSEGCTAGEDVEFQIKAFVRAGRISILDRCPYIYMHHADMGSVRDVDDREKKLSRYSQLIGVDMRLADYLEEHASSKELRHLAKCLLRPEGVIRMFSVAAKRGDRDEYVRLRSDPKIMEQLRPALKMAFTRPEVFFKAAMLLYAPGLFYKVRA